MARTRGPNKPTKRVTDIDNCSYTQVCKMMRETTDLEFKLKCATALLPYQKRKMPVAVEVTNHEPVAAITLQVITQSPRPLLSAKP